RHHGEKLHQRESPRFSHLFSSSFDTPDGGASMLLRSGLRKEVEGGRPWTAPGEGSALLLRLGGG
ncbi:MAG: hypothetical protein WBX15_05355, partial [Thermoanaerobaculia bacterium]